MKKLFRIVVPLIFIGIATFSILLVIKPGASIFHFKQSIDTDEIIPHDGHAFRCQIHLNTLIFPTEGGLLYEDDQPLERTFTPEVVNKGLGNYSLVDKDNGLLYLNFSASDNSNPLTNGKKYTLYYKAIFLSRGMGLSLLGILTLVLAWFLIFTFKSPGRRQALTNSPLSIWNVFDDFLSQEFIKVINPVTNPQSLTQSRRTLWIFLLILSVAAAYFYVFMEWVFFITKPSFMDLMGWYEKLEVFLLSSFALAVLSLALVMVFAGLNILSSRLRSATVLIFIGTLIPSIILTAISLILLDNFTYTIFNFGVETSDGIWRYAYGIGFLVLFVHINNRILRVMGLRGQSESPLKIPRITLAIAAGLLLISAGFALARFGFGYSENVRVVSPAGNNNRFATHPNILLIGSDGLSASNMSVYGYERDTTPVLRELARTSLLAENVFANSSNTTGSITSLLTGKSPAQTRVLYPHNILQGADAYQHLPGILRKEGYSTVQIGVRNYVDAYQINMLGGFDTVNERSIIESEMVRVPRQLGFGDNVYFGSRLVERISDRILHISFIKEMENPYTIVTQHVDKRYDRERQDQLLELIRNSDHPLMMHVHMMGTHGARFNPEYQFFSLGMSQKEDWMIDFYDDSILNFDKYIGEILDTLEQTGMITNTILIIYSDHPMNFNVRRRVPLLIHFPNGDFAGRIKTNVQNLDIPPTILDYLGFELPEWMSGQSLLNGNPSERRLIFSTGTSLSTQIGHGKTGIDSTRIKPPFYQFSFFNVINCQKWYLLDLVSHTWSSGEVPGYTSHCRQDSLLTMDQVKVELTDYLIANGFDISALP